MRSGDHLRHASGKMLPYVNHNILWVQPKVCVDPFPISWDRVKMMSQELWCYIFGYIWNTGLCIGSLMLSIRPLLVNNILTCIVIVAKSMKSFFTKWAIFLHERSCIGLIYCCKSNFMCVNLCKIMKSRWFLNHTLRYSDLNSVTIFIIFLRE